jgi:hypothetical protein
LVLILHVPSFSLLGPNIVLKISRKFIFG